LQPEHTTNHTKPSTQQCQPKRIAMSETRTPQRCPRKTKVIQTPTKYKVQRDALPGQPRGRINQVVSLLCLGGIIELIGVWNEEGTDDGYDPFLKVSVRDHNTFSQRSGIFKLAERRGLPGTAYEYMPSLQSQRKRNGDPFPRHWYMRLVNEEANEDSVEVRRKIVQSVCNVSFADLTLFSHNCNCNCHPSFH